MKKLPILLGTIILSVSMMSFTGSNQYLSGNNNDLPETAILEPEALFEEAICKDEAARNLMPEQIVLIEAEEEVVLEFNTDEYLPLGFNAYSGRKLNLNDILIEEKEEILDLGFDVGLYLPKGFDAYAK